MLAGKYDIMYFVSDFNGFCVVSVHGIDSDRGQDHVVFSVDGDLDLADKSVKHVGGVGVGNFDVDRAVPRVGAVVVQHEVVCSADIGKTQDGLFYAVRKVGVVSFAEQPRNRVFQHFNARFYDHERDHRAEPRFKRDPCDQKNCRRDKCRSRDHGIQRRVLA